MQSYAKVIDNEVVEIIRNKQPLKPAGTHWRELECVKPQFDKETEYLVISHYEVFANKVVEYYKVEAINFEPMPVEDEEIK